MMQHRVRCIHFVGIGGIGMSGIAELLYNQKFCVQGSDSSSNANVERLRNLGIKVWHGHDATQIAGAEVLVVSSAINNDNPEIQAARHAGIPIIPRAEMLAELMRMKYSVAVAGSHGKTSITSMIAHGMESAGMDPTYVIGGRLIASGDNARLGASPYIVAEADESDGSFLHLSPFIAVVSNIDPEHLEHYGDFANLCIAFQQFVGRVPFYGCAVLHHEHPHVAALRDNLHRPVRTYGSSPQANISLLETIPDNTGQNIRVAVNKGQKKEISLEYHLAMPGVHNAENSLAAVAVLLEFGLNATQIKQGMESFSGIQRRFQRTDIGNAVLIDDYAHHPSEIRATLAAARDCWPHRTISVIFQPHRYTRTRDLMAEFLGAFDLAEYVYLLPVYAAGETYINHADSESMQLAMQARGHRGVKLLAATDAYQQAEKILQQDNILILMGAGSIGKLAADLRLLAE
ncbi:MAG: UDP-N-acetylmuramate--L-alanine ligase [Mariprofundales bacterium]